MTAALERLGPVAACVVTLLSAVACAPGYGPPPGPFPNLTAAEDSLQSAIMSLRQAPPMFAGHKAEAVRLIEAAIGEIEAAKASAR